jgi:hypothetical protein
VRRIVCLLRGHQYATVNFDGRGRRFRVAKCVRCGRFDRDSITVEPLNREIRRRWARDVARKVAKA